MAASRLRRASMVGGLAVTPLRALACDAAVASGVGRGCTPNRVGTDCPAAHRDRHVYHWGSHGVPSLG
eukprot:8309980-Alexandrium_andersonii.AAC.1